MSPHQLLWQHNRQKGHLDLRKLKKSVPWHTHNFNELVFVLNGSGIHVIGSDNYPLMRGDVFVIKGSQTHKFENNKNLFVANLEYMREHFETLENEIADLPGFKALFVHEPLYRKNQKFKAKLHLSSWQLNEISVLLNSIKKEEETKRPGYNAILESLFKIVVVTVCRFYSETESSSSKKLLKISSAIDFIETNFSKKITRAALAENAGMNFNSFCKLFKETTGCSPINYLIRFRIEKAVEMMDTNNKTNVINTAMSCGFENSSYFSRKFKQIVGTTPIKYLKKSKSLESKN